MEYGRSIKCCQISSGDPQRHFVMLRQALHHPLNIYEFRMIWGWHKKLVNNTAFWHFVLRHGSQSLLAQACILSEMQAKDMYKAATCVTFWYIFYGAKVWFPVFFDFHTCHRCSCLPPKTRAKVAKVCLHELKKAFAKSRIALLSWGSNNSDCVGFS